jgi:hypothetical protein
VRAQLLRLDPATYRSHPLHSGNRVWAETNRSVDAWIEVLHALGLDPVPAGAVALSSDFEGDQWTFLKYAPEDLRTLYGIDVAEIEVWRPLPDHIEDYLRRGRLLALEVDPWYLPDTAGVSYRIGHAKTTIVPQMIDRAEQRLGYFHNAGYYELSGHDYLGVLRVERPAGLPPHVEVLRRGGEALGGARLAEAGRALASSYLARRPPTNPVERFGTRLAKDLTTIAERGPAHFQQYALATCQQCGAAAEIAASFVTWLDGVAGQSDKSKGAQLLLALAEDAKALKFVLARAAAGRGVVVDGLLERMADAWDEAMASLDDRYGRGAV